jgi:cytochrome c peroxidase
LLQAYNTLETRHSRPALFVYPVVAACIAVFANCSGVGESPPEVPLGLPAVAVPADNPVTPIKVELGRKIFVDRRLSASGKTACADCHVPDQGFTTTDRSVCVGAGGTSQRRNSPTLLNVAYSAKLYHDGRENSLENQVWGPLLGRDEMNNPSTGDVVVKIRNLADYEGQFEAAFAGRGPSADTIADALASFERTLVSGNSRFDRWRYARDAEAMNASERRGFELFTGKAGCSACHLIGEKFALFTDQRFHNTGIGWAHSQRTVPQPPAPATNAQRNTLPSPHKSPETDEGRYEVTRDPADRWAYRTPSLRNIAVTWPYMHDGSIATLDEVIEFYDKGGIDNPGKDERLRPLGLTSWEKSALVSFLYTLTGDNVTLLGRSTKNYPLVSRQEQEIGRTAVAVRPPRTEQASCYFLGAVGAGAAAADLGGSAGLAPAAGAAAGGEAAGSACWPGGVGAGGIGQSTATGVTVTPLAFWSLI